MMRTASALAALLCCALPACSSFTAPADSARRNEFSHYDPVMLNEFAVARVRDGDISTAWILLERAARLAPHDQRITRNLAVLRAFREGTLDSASSAEAADSAGSGAQPNGSFPEPPPMWKPN